MARTVSFHPGARQMGPHYRLRKIAEFARQWARRSDEARDGGPADADGSESDT